MILQLAAALICILTLSSSSAAYLTLSFRNRATSTTALHIASRRSMLSVAGVAFWSTPAFAGLLDDYGTDPKQLEKKETTKTLVPSTIGGTEKQIDPTLKGSYYYPTAKKRYLPRIVKASQQIEKLPDAIAAADWETIALYDKDIENAILPLQLYQSSLDGQGLSMSSSFAKEMKKDAVNYEKSYKLFAKALSKKDTNSLLSATTDMAALIADYRQQGRLNSDDDDGTTIPTVEEMRRMAMRRPTMKN